MPVKTVGKNTTLRSDTKNKDKIVRGLRWTLDTLSFSNLVDSLCGKRRYAIIVMGTDSR